MSWTNDLAVGVGPMLVGLAAFIQSTRANRSASGAREEAASANNAVNHKRDDEPTMFQQVRDLGATVERIDSRTTIMRDQLDDARDRVATVQQGVTKVQAGFETLDRRLDRHLAQHQREYEKIHSAVENITTQD